MTSETTELKRRFHDVVNSEDELRSVVGYPQKRALDKELPVIDDASRRFIAHAPFVFIASSSEKSVLDISPRGDPAGFVLFWTSVHSRFPTDWAIVVSTLSAMCLSIRMSH